MRHSSNLLYASISYSKISGSIHQISCFKTFVVKEEKEGQMKLVLSVSKAMTVCSRVFTKQLIIQTYHVNKQFPHMGPR